MEKSEILKELEEFKKEFIRKTNLETYEKFSKLFRVEAFFLREENLYFNNRFNSTIFEIENNTLRFYLNEFEYYVNIQQVSLLSKIDSEILSEDLIKNLRELYLKLAIEFRKNNKLYFESKENDDEIIENLNKIISLIEECSKKAALMQVKFIDNINDKIKENKNKKKEEYSSSIFN